MKSSLSSKAGHPESDALPEELVVPLIFRPRRVFLVPQLSACLALMLGGLVLPMLGLVGARDGLDSTEILYLQGGIPLMLVMIWVGLISAYGILHQELRLDAKGLVWTTRRFSLSSSWSNVDKIRRVPLPRGSMLGLALKHPGQLQRRNPHWPQVFPDSGIPLEIFGNPWHGKLHQALRHFAPVLFDASESAKAD